MAKKTDLAIVNRGFWPHDQVIGEGLLQFAEKASEQHRVCVITQTATDLSAQLATASRGTGLSIRACKAYTTSASGVLKRISEALFFMGFTFVSLIRSKPANVYVATNPPVVVPFIVALYCRLFGARYVYHLQDIHPEAAEIIIPLNRLLLRILKAVDNYTLRHAAAIVTLSEDMKVYIRQRSDTSSPILLLDNPSFSVTPVPAEERSKDIVYCGNAGRLQRIPLLMSAIRAYLQQGGKLRFTFAGGGVHAPDIQALANAYEQVDYLGVLPATEAAELVNEHRWALLPIDDEVTKYAFPSKSSGYALSGAGVLAVCGEQTSVARWVKQEQVGIVCQPDHDELVKCFFMLEEIDARDFALRDEVRKRLQISYFAQKLRDISLDLQ
nr:glycosyltransferase [Thalassolituus pacificus]